MFVAHPLLPVPMQKEVALESLKIMTSTIEGAQLDSLDLSHNALGEAGLRAASVAITSQVRDGMQ